MADEQKGVEGVAANAPSGTGVEKPGGETPPASAKAPADDPVAELERLRAELARKDEQLTKTERDRDNYRAATLVYKGKEVEISDLDLTDPTQTRAYVDRIVEERLLAERNSSAKKSYDAFADRLARENKELKLALTNKVSVANAGAGGGVNENSESKVSYWSPEQIADLKKRGWSDDKIKKAEQHARALANGPH